MFRGRNDVVREMVEMSKQLKLLNRDEFIKISQHFDFPNLKNLTEDTESMRLNSETIRSFLNKEIESFCTMIIEGMLDIKLIDNEFFNQIYEVDKQLFEKIFKTALIKFIGKLGFDAGLNIIGSLKYFHQAIIGYEMAFHQVKDVNEKYELKRKLLKVLKMPAFSQLEDYEQAKFTSILKKLPVLPEEEEERWQEIRYNVMMDHLCDLGD